MNLITEKQEKKNSAMNPLNRYLFLMKPLVNPLMVN
jgi:hypothetical protein